MSGEWQVVDTLQKKKEKLQQKHAENAVESAAKEKKRQEERREKEAELKRLGLGFSISDVSSDYKKKQNGKGKGKGKGKGYAKIEANYDVDIPSDEPKKKDKSDKKKDKESKEPKAPKQPKEFKDKTGYTLASACESLDADSLRSELKKIEIQHSSLPVLQLQNLTELLESSFPKIRAFTKHEQGHLYRRIHSPIRTLQERNEKVFNLVRDWIGDRPIPSDFVAFLVDLLVEPVTQGVAVRIVLSLIARNHPQKIVAESSYIFSKLPLRTVAWIFLQTMYADPDIAMLLWVKHFLPLFYTSEKENPEAVIYLACLFTYIRKKGHKINVPMRPDDLASELGKFLTARATASGNSQIKDHYYELLDSAFMVSKAPRELFVELLRLTSSDSQEVSNAAFDVIVYNLKTNTDLFRIWKEIYAEHVVQTNNVLVFILRNYEHIQTSSLPPIVREAYTYASDASSGDEDSSEEEKKGSKKGAKIREFGAMMELNGKMISASRKHAGPVRAHPISVHELGLLLTRVEEVNTQLANASKKARAKGSGLGSKQSLQVCNTTCRALRATMSQSRSGHDAGGGGCAGTLAKLTIAVAGLAGIAAYALRYSNPEVFDQLLRSLN